jgi:hypothetical protein
MSEIRVKCYAGYGADERPLRFTLRDREFEVYDESLPDSPLT